MEAVFAHVVFFVEFAGDGVHVGFGAHALVEGGVEDGYVGDAGEDLFAGLDAAEVGGVMERAEDDAFADAFLDGFVDLDGLGVGLAAVQDPVADGFDLGEGFQHAAGRVDQFFADGAQGFAVVLDGQVFFEFAVVAGMVDQMGIFHPDPFHQAFGQDGFVRHAE